MNKDLISAVLTFAILIGGTAAIGSELLQSPQAPTLAAAEQTLPMVVVTGQRSASTTVAAQQVVAEPTQIR